MTPVIAAVLMLAAGTFQPQVTGPAGTRDVAAPFKAEGPYRVLRTLEVGGEGGWDLVTIDSATGRLFVPRSTHVIVIDTASGKQVGEIAGTEGVHGVAVAPTLGKGFTSNGKSGDVTVFDLSSLKVIQRVKAGKNPDAIIFEPATKRVLCFNGKSSDATVISAETLSPLGTIELGGKPELPVTDGEGKVFVNLEDKSEIVKLDAATMKVEQRWSLAPGEEPTGLAFDPVHHRLFAACANEKMVVVDSQTGKVVATPTIGKHPDGADFDAAAGFAMSSNGEGTLTVIGATADQPYGVVQTLPTHQGARTIVQDPKTRLIYLPAADYEEAKAGARPKMKPGTFKIIVVGPSTDAPKHP